MVKITSPPPQNIQYVTGIIWTWIASFIIEENWGKHCNSFNAFYAKALVPILNMTKDLRYMRYTSWFDTRLYKICILDYREKLYLLLCVKQNL